MGKKYYKPPSESFCQYIFKALVQRYEKDLVFYTPERDTVIQEKRCDWTGVKLLKSSETRLSDESEDLPREDVDRCTDYPVDASHSLPPSLEKEGIKITIKDFIGNNAPKESISSSFRDFVSKKLSERLEKEMQLSSGFSHFRKRQDCKDAILLFKCARNTVTDSETLETTRPSRADSKRKRSCEVAWRDRLLESSVSIDSIVSGAMTMGWTETKRIKLVSLRCVQTLSDGSLQCQPIA